MAQQLSEICPFDENEARTLTSSALGVVLELDGFEQQEVSRAGVEPTQGLETGQGAVTSELGSIIRRVADSLNNDPQFTGAVAKVKVPEHEEKGAYELFRDVAWDVCFRSGRITWARVAGLFVFAGKLAAKVVRGLASAVDRIRQLVGLIINWMCSFIRDYLWSWIAGSGGWVGGHISKLQRIKLIIY